MKAYGKTDKGRIRPTNQDAFAVDTEEQVALLAVCDGMGGARAGNVASRFAIENFMKTLKGAVTPEIGETEIHEALLDAVAEANRVVFELATKQEAFRGMGTTLVGAVDVGKRLSIVNIGDSRAYVIDKNGANQVTLDHSYVEEMLRSGQISEEVARDHPQRNLITRAIGVAFDVEGDIYDITLSPGQVLLLCSDGLTGMVTDEQIAALIMQSENLEQAAEALIAHACANGGRDNITVVLYKREKDKKENDEGSDGQ